MKLEVCNAARGNTLKHLVGRCRNGIAHLYELQVLALQSGVLVAELARCDDLTSLEIL